MKLRMWHSFVPNQNAQVFLAFLRKRAIPDYQSIPGNISVHLLIKEKDDITHFITMSFWENLDFAQTSITGNVENEKHDPAYTGFPQELEQIVECYEVVGQSVSPAFLLETWNVNSGKG